MVRVPGEHVVLTSGFDPHLVQSLRKRWRITDLPDQQEALAFVRALDELPACIVIGNVVEPQPAGTLSAWKMLEELRRLSPDLPIIVSTTVTTPRVVVQLGRQGAFDFVAEPEDRADPQQVALYAEALRLAIDRAVQLHCTRRENSQLRSALAEETTFIARADSMRAVMQLADKVAPTVATVLITGESGTGKELLARHIHRLSRAAVHGFTAVNCGALSESLLAAELFGSVRGAFTGADRDRVGLLQRAGSGTLFLDEIATIGANFQVMLLRVLEERLAQPVGGASDYPVRCRFIAAANRDLEQMVRQGAFREDLWYRLNVFRIHLPPLRHRREEIPMLAQRFLEQMGRHYGKVVDGFEPAAMSLLERHHWPGNVRELRNAVERAIIVAEGRRITPTDLATVNPSPAPVVAAEPSEHRCDQSYHATLERCERELIVAALRHCGGNLTAAAQHLKLKRTTLQYRLRRLGLSWQLLPNAMP